MNDIQFIQLGKEVLNEIQLEEEIEKITPKLYKIQNYIFNNPNKKCVQDFINTLLNIYKNLFYKKELIEAFNLPNNLYYYKQIQIYLNLPYTKHPNYAYYLPKILIVPSNIYGDIYATFYYVLQKYEPNLVSDGYMQDILNFTSQNHNIMFGSKDIYYSLNDEINFFDKARKNLRFKELEDFLSYERNTINSFLNKRIGNIGEIYTYSLITNLFFNHFVSKDIKSGFGYDIYFIDNYIETLVEVKTTMNNCEDDYFIISENEYKVMKSCSSNPYARYIICRVKLDSSFNPTYTLLTSKDCISLIDIQNNEIEYKLFPSTDRNFLYKRHSPIRKLSL